MTLVLAPAALAAAVLAGAAGQLALPDAGRGARRRLRRLTSPGGGVHLPGPVLLDLVAAVLQAGVPVAAALRVVGDSARSHGDDTSAGHLERLADRHDLGLDGAPGESPPWAVALEEALLLARDAGVAVAPLLARASAQERRRATAAARVAAARLGVRVVLPTGLCLLPAFVLLAVVPLVLALLGAV